MRPLLLLVDLQRDYLEAPDLEPGAAAVVSRATALLSGCRALGVPVAHAWTTVSRADDRRMPHWARDGLWRCEVGTPGHEPPAGLEAREGEAVVHKTFFSAFSTGDLDRVLRHRGIDLLVVAGVHLHGCVRETVLDAYERGGLEIWVAEDAVGSDDPVHAAITQRYLERRAATFLPVAEVVARLRDPGEPLQGREASEEPIRAAARRAREALPAWQETDAGARAVHLERLADQLEPEADRLALAMAEQIGKPVRYGSVEVRRTADMLRAVARRATEEEGGHDATGGAGVWRLPLGLVAVITPWNNPVYIPLGKIAPALAFGNAVLWKPAPAAQGVAERVAALLDEAGLPAGTVALVTGGRRTAAAVMNDPSVDAVTLTGSSLAGSAAQEICARRRIPLQAELGGNNAAVVWPDADLDEAARLIAEGAFALAGQRCTANRRVVVHRSCREGLLDRLERETAGLPWGDPRVPETRVGPIVGAEQRDRIADAVGRAEGLGPVVVPHGATAPDADGFDGAWYPPTIVCTEDASHELVQEETFGPVLVVQTADDWDQAIALANGVRQGLVAALFSSSPDLAARFPNEVHAGIVKINRSTADADVDVPFGGWKRSGLGPPEHGAFDRDAFTRPQTVYRDPTV